MNNDKFIRLETLRDVGLALRYEQSNGCIIPDVVFEALKTLEDSYDLPGEVINEQSEHGID